MKQDVNKLASTQIGQETTNLVTTGHFVTNDKVDSCKNMDAYEQKVAIGDPVSNKDTLNYYVDKVKAGQELTAADVVARDTEHDGEKSDLVAAVNNEFHNGTDVTYLAAMKELIALDPDAAAKVKAQNMAEYKSDQAAIARQQGTTGVSDSVELASDDNDGRGILGKLHDSLIDVRDRQLAEAKEGLDLLNTPGFEAVGLTKVTLNGGVAFVADIEASMFPEKGDTQWTAFAFLTGPANEVIEGVEILTKEAGITESAVKNANNVRWGMWSDLEKVTEEGREYVQIDGRLYTHEAIDRMTPTSFGTAAGGYQGRGIPTIVIDDVIKNGTSTNVVKDGVTRTIFENNGVRVVTEQNGKLIITAMKIKK